MASETIALVVPILPVRDLRRAIVLRDSDGNQLIFGESLSEDQQ